MVCLFPGVRPSIASLEVDRMQECILFPLEQKLCVAYHEVGHVLCPAYGRNMWRDGHSWVTPKRTLRGQWLLAEDIQDGMLVGPGTPISFAQTLLLLSASPRSQSSQAQRRMWARKWTLMKPASRASIQSASLTATSPRPALITTVPCTHRIRPINRNPSLPIDAPRGLGAPLERASGSAEGWSCSGSRASPRCWAAVPPQNHAPSRLRPRTWCIPARPLKARRVRTRSVGETGHPTPVP